MIRPLAAFAAVAVLAACGHAGSDGKTADGHDVLGYVRMADLVKVHPLFSQLDGYDRALESFALASTVPQALAGGNGTSARERALEKQLDDASKRTKSLLDEKQRKYQAEENQAISAALRGGGGGARSAGQIAGTLDATAAQQSNAAAAGAQRDFDAYRLSLEKSDNAEAVAAERALADRADRTYRAKAEELQSRESSLSLRLANEDAAERLSLHTKLSSLAMDDSAREDAQKSLNALDKKEAVAVGAQRSADSATLAALQKTLKAGVQSDMAARESSIRSRTIALLDARRKALGARVGAAPELPATADAGPAANPNISPALRARIEALHKDYQQRFQNDAKTTVADFTRTREDLARRYASLQGVDLDAQRGAGNQIGALQKKRDDLYSQMTAQISREVQLVAQQRGVTVVVTDPIAPVAGVDLTSDAAKDIESLHQ